MTDFTTYIGFIAALCTSFSFIPQAYKVIKTKDTRGISLAMYVIFVFGVFLWLVYGILIKDLPMIAANVVTISLASLILFIKIKNRKKESQIPK